MTYTSHGHHIPGSGVSDELGQVGRQRCGGPAACTVCQKDIARFLSPDTPDPEIEEFFRDLDEYPDPNLFLNRAKLFVIGAYNNRVADEVVQLSVDDLRIVWFSKTLDNWKALVCTVFPGDGLYFEVTHNGAKEETYVDTYIKISNDKFSQEGND